MPEHCLAAWNESKGLARCAPYTEIAKLIAELGNAWQLKSGRLQCQIGLLSGQNQTGAVAAV